MEHNSKEKSKQEATNHNTAALDYARTYTARGWRVVPVPYKSKRANIEGWQKLRLNDSDLTTYFNMPRLNIGGLLGEPSGNLVDVDLDCPETVSLASTFLPQTGSVFGRASKPKSHYLYTSVCKTKKYQDPTKEKSQNSDERQNAMLVEIRSTGLQTLLPGSVNPSGETVTWSDAGDPANVNADELQGAVARLASAALLARHWPGEGARQDAAMALAGGLLRGGWAEAETERFIEAVCMTAGDEETSERVKTVSYTAQKLQAGKEVTGLPRLAELTDERIVKRVRGWLSIKESKASATDGQPEADEQNSADRTRSQATRLVELAGSAELFATPDAEAYASLTVENHVETWALRSSGFKNWLARRYYETYGDAPSTNTLKDALGVLEGKAHYEGKSQSVFTRIAEHEGAFYLDLSDEEWRAVKVTPSGWEVIQNPPVKFRRKKGMLPLPVPVRGGSVGELDKFVNVYGSDRVLLKAWLVAALKPSGPHPILVFHGEQGSAKTTTARVLCDLIDPNMAALRSEPRNEQDLIIAATNRMVVAYDNLSRLPVWLSDALCRLSTGGGYSTRQLYTDGEEKLFNVQRPALLTGIEELATRGDLLSRSIVVYLPPISEIGRRAEGDFWPEFVAARPRILGALLDAVSGAMREVDNVKLERSPRMADFARWATATEPFLGLEAGEFMSSYDENREEANSVALESSPVASAVRIYTSREPDWVGTAGDLLKALSRIADDEARRQFSWPKTPQRLSNELRRLAPSLRADGVDVLIGDKSMREAGTGRRLIRLRKLKDTSSQSSQSSQAANSAATDVTTCDGGGGSLFNSSHPKASDNGRCDDSDSCDAPSQTLTNSGGLDSLPF